MKIVQQTPSRLVAQLDYKLGCLLLPIALPGLICLLFVPNHFVEATRGVTTLTCKRVEPTQTNCNLKEPNWLLPWLARDTSFSQLRGTEVELACEDVSKVWLRTNTGRIRLVAGYGWCNLNEGRTVAKINEFITNSNQTSLTVKVQPERIGGLVLFLSLLGYGVFGGVLLLFIASIQRSSVTFDKNIGKVVEVKRNWFGKTASEWFLSEVKEVQVQADVSKDSDGAQTTFYKVAIVLASGEIITELSRFSTADRERQQAFADRICSFLGFTAN